MESKNINYFPLIALALLAAVWLVGAKTTERNGDRLAGLEEQLINSGVIDSNLAKSRLNFLWAFGLANKNEILEKGPMSPAHPAGGDPRYDTGGFASTGGWVPSKGGAMDHYSRHEFIKLTAEQQQLVEKLAKNIYRPCCNNPTYFPDCNHGMAMLGLLELLAAESASEEEMYRAALQANSEWFPDEYQNIARYFAAKGLTLDDVGAKEILSAKYSSASGYQQILQSLHSPEIGGGGSC